MGIQPVKFKENWGGESYYTMVAPNSVSYTDINRDFHIAMGCLKDLDKEELKGLFQELELFYATVQDSFHNSSRNGYAEDLMRSWILGQDGVLISEKYEGGATWENLKKALRKLNHLGTAKKIV